jgi:hypothetical protein
MKSDNMWDLGTEGGQQRLLITTALKLEEGSLRRSSHCELVTGIWPVGMGCPAVARPGLSRRSRLAHKN